MADLSAQVSQCAGAHPKQLGVGNQVLRQQRSFYCAGNRSLQLPIELRLVRASGARQRRGKFHLPVGATQSDRFLDHRVAVETTSKILR